MLSPTFTLITKRIQKSEISLNKLATVSDGCSFVVGKYWCPYFGGSL